MSNPDTAEVRRLVKELAKLKAEYDDLLAERNYFAILVGIRKD